MNRREFINSAFIVCLLCIIKPTLPTDINQKHTYETFAIADGTFMLFKKIEPGTFLMGSQDTTRKEMDGPPHKVTISKTFYIGVYEVTQQQWNKVMQKLPWNSPSQFSGQLNNPIENISWQEVHEFLDRINKYDSNSAFRLPTEAEWEYACRAGTTTRTYWGDDPDHKNAEWSAWLGGYPYGTTHSVGQLNPNAWGLYDMCGNVVEFTEDRFSMYTSEDQIDPLVIEGDFVVARGGDWFHAHGVDSETRRKYNDHSGLSFLGFRVVRSID